MRLSDKRHDTRVEGRNVDPECAVEECAIAREVTAWNQRRHKRSHAIGIEQDAAGASAAAGVEQSGGRLGTETVGLHEVGEERRDNLVPAKMKSERNLICSDVAGPSVGRAVFCVNEVCIGEAGIAGGEDATNFKRGWPILG